MTLCVARDQSSLALVDRSDLLDQHRPVFLLGCPDSGLGQVNQLWRMARVISCPLLPIFAPGVECCTASGTDHPTAMDRRRSPTAIVSHGVV